MWKFIPLVVVVMLFGLLGWGLFGPKQLDFGQREIKAVIVGKTVRDFTLTSLDNGETFSSAELKGKVWILNVWSSWCVSCIQEHQVLRAMAAADIPIYGLNYQDKLEDARNWLARNGNPYKMTFQDNGKVSLDFGVYGVPESFVIDKQGTIRHKFTGPINKGEVDKIIKPLIKELQG